MSHPSSARPLQGRTALVTGVSRRRGIGYAVAVELANSSWIRSTAADRSGLHSTNSA